jgi:hypothetical protein
MYTMEITTMRRSNSVLLAIYQTWGLVRMSEDARTVIREQIDLVHRRLAYEQLIRPIPLKAAGAQKEADVWISDACPKLWEYIPAFLDSNVLEKSDQGYDWKCSQASLRFLMDRLGFDGWAKLAQYFTIKGEQIKIGSLKNQLLYGPPRDWPKIKAAIPALL